MLHRNAAGDEPGGRVPLEFLFQFGTPAEPGKPRDHSGLGQRETPFALVDAPRGAREGSEREVRADPRADAKSSVVMIRTSSVAGRTKG